MGIPMSQTSCLALIFGITLALAQYNPCQFTIQEQSINITIDREANLTADWECIEGEEIRVDRDEDGKYDLIVENGRVCRRINEFCAEGEIIKIDEDGDGKFESILKKGKICVKSIEFSYRYEGILSLIEKFFRGLMDLIRRITNFIV